MVRRLISLLLPLALASCVSVAPTNYGSQSSKALFIAAIRTDVGSFRHIFRRVDRATNSFVGEPVIFYTESAVGMLSTHNQLNLGDAQRTVILAASEVPPGEYVRVEVFQSYPVVQGVTAAVREWCLHTGPIYSLSPGTISIVRVDDIGEPARRPVSDASVLTDFARARAQRENLQGEPVIARPVSWAQWDSREANVWASRSCAESASFEVIAVPN